MVDSQILNEIHQRLSMISALVAEIEAVPNLPLSVWEMKSIKKKCREIQSHCHWIATHLGTGSGGSLGSTGYGY